jgi:hypothetical protein
MERIELVWNGEVIRRIEPANEPSGEALVTRFELTLPAEESGWLAARCLGGASNTGGIPFAHTAPWHVEVANRPLRPRRREVQYFLERVEQEIERNQSILTREQLADYYQARDFWRKKLDQAIDP